MHFTISDTYYVVKCLDVMDMFIGWEVAGCSYRLHKEVEYLLMRTNTGDGLEKKKGQGT